MPRTGQPSTRDVEATVRAVEILDALADGGELGTSEVARRTGISPSTVSRQLGTLTRVGLVEHVTTTGRYRLGVRTGIGHVGVVVAATGPGWGGLDVVDCAGRRPPAIAHRPDGGALWGRRGGIVVRRV